METIEYTDPNLNCRIEIRLTDDGQHVKGILLCFAEDPLPLGVLWGGGNILHALSTAAMRRSAPVPPVQLTRIVRPGGPCEGCR